MKLALLLILGAGGAAVAVLPGAQDPGGSHGAAQACCSAPSAPSSPPVRWAAGGTGERPTLECVKRMAGSWAEVGPDGRPTERVLAEYRVTAGGQVVVETVFPGTAQEMLTLYYQEGEELMLTHYCLLGAHPRMRARLDAQTEEVVFACAGGANFADCASAHHMHEARFRALGDDRMRVAWTDMDDGRRNDQPVVMDMARVR